MHIWNSYLLFTLFSSRLCDAAACVWWYAAATVSRDTTTSTVTPTCSPTCPSICCPISFTCSNFCWSSYPSHSPPCIHPSYTRCSHYQLCSSPANIYSLSGIYSCGELHMSALEKEFLVEQSASVCKPDAYLSLIVILCLLAPPPPFQKGFLAPSTHVEYVSRTVNLVICLSGRVYFHWVLSISVTFAVTEFKLDFLCFFICQTASMRVSLCICFTFGVFICLFSDYSLFLLFWFNDSLT